MSFFELHLTGGLEFMVPLSLMALSIIVLSLRKGYDLFNPSGVSLAGTWQGLDWILYLGSFAFFWGILGHAIGIYAALQAIEAAGNISPAILAGGLKIAMIVPLYGLIILLGASIVWFLLRMRCKQMSQKLNSQ